MILLLASRLLHTFASLGPETHHANVAVVGKAEQLIRSLTTQQQQGLRSLSKP